MTRQARSLGMLLIILIVVVSACTFPSLVTEPSETDVELPPDNTDALATDEPAPDGGEAPPGPQPGDLPRELICEPLEPGSLFSVVCNVRDAFRSRNLSTLMTFIAEPFYLAYYQSEGTQTDAEGAINEFRSRLPDNPSQMEFIIDRETFPNLYDVPPEAYMSFEDNLALVVYSPGWSGATDMLLYFTRTADGQFKFNGALVSLIGFD